MRSHHDHDGGAGGAQDIVLASKELLDSAGRMVEQLDEFPAGSVLRCFSRAVRLARRSGCPLDRLASDAERLTLVLLTDRRSSNGVVSRDSSPAGCR